MKKLFTCTLTALLATITISTAAPDQAALEAKEKAVWQAFGHKKADDFKKFVATDMMAVYPDGIYDLQKEIDEMAKTDMKSFSLSDFKLVMTDKDTALLTYKAKVEVTTGGKDMSGDYNCGTVWQMKKGAWHAVFHTDMKAEAPATDAQKKE
ncbi:MAG: nuclear transport factor 2 family protein [Chthoniobacterales bacterium]